MMPEKMRNSDTMLVKIRKSGHDAEEPEIKRRDQIWERCWRTENNTKGLNLGTMPKNLKQMKGLNPSAMAGELETKGRDQIWAQCRRTRNKTKGSNSSAMPKNPKQKKKGSNPGAMPENSKQNKGIESGRNAREPETKEGIRIQA